MNGKTINVVVAHKQPIKVISSGATSDTIVPSNPVVLKNVPTLTPIVGATTLGQLRDVYLGNEVDGATLVYHADTDTYVAETISFDVGGSIDGGVF